MLRDLSSENYQTFFRFTGSELALLLVGEVKVYLLLCNLSHKCADGKEFFGSVVVTFSGVCMREIFQIKIIGPKSEQLVPLKNGVMSNRVRAQALEKFEILEVVTGKAPKKVLSQRAGDDQIVKVIDEVSGEKFDLVIEDFHS